MIDTEERWTYFTRRLVFSHIYCLRYLNIFNLVNDDRADLSKLMLVPVPEVLDEHELVPGRVLRPPVLTDARLVCKSCEHMINNVPWKHRIHPPYIYPSYTCCCCCLGSVDHLLLVVLLLPVPADVAAQVDEREQVWLCNSLCLGSVEHFLLVVLVQPVLAVLADQGDVELEEAKLAAEDEELEI